VRAEVYNETLESRSQPRAPYYTHEEFTLMLEKEQVQTVVVTTVDCYHDIYIVKALEAGGVFEGREASENGLTADSLPP
jgi:predicted dehydrogenase